MPGKSNTPLVLMNADTHRGSRKTERHSTCFERVWERDAFEKITNACKRIEQLSIAFPMTYIGGQTSRPPRTCRCPTCTLTWTTGHHNTADFDAFSDALGNLPNLVTLNTTTWPQNKQASQQLPRKMYEALLCAEAQEGFEGSVVNAKRKAAEDSTEPNEPKFTNSKLRVIAYGVNDKALENSDSSNIIVFYRGQSIDPLGGPPKVQALKVGMGMLQYYEADSDILEHHLSHHPAPPVLAREIHDDEGPDW